MNGKEEKVCKGCRQRSHNEQTENGGAKDEMSGLVFPGFSS